LQELKICAAIIDIFHLIPAASQKMLEPLTVTVLKGEKDLYIEVELTDVEVYVVSTDELILPRKT